MVASNVNEALRMFLVPIGDLKEDPANVRKHGKRNLDAIADSLRRFGQQKPVVALLDGTVIAGNGTLLAARDLFWDDLAVVRFPDIAQARAYAIADNRTAELAEWNYAELEAQLTELGDTSFLESMAFDLEKKVAGAFGEQEPVDAEPVPPPETPVTRPGDIWTLGDHVLVCGDATNLETVLAAGGAGEGALLFTDPPYNVNYEGKTKDRLTINNDDMEDSEFLMFLVRAFQAADAFMRPGAAFYICHADSEGLAFRTAVRDAHWKLAQCIVWVKDQFVMGRQDYHWRHEPILYGWKLGAAHHALVDRTQDTVWEIPRPRASEAHPTMKPVDLVLRAIKNSTEPGELVLDPFGGSGTTLLACESSGRRARLVELDPKYCDVIIRRWQDATGKEATLRGESFADWARSRNHEPAADTP